MMTIDDDNIIDDNDNGDVVADYKEETEDYLF